MKKVLFAVSAVLWVLAGFFPASAETRAAWRVDCGAQKMCAVSKFVKAAGVPNLAVGLIFSSAREGVSKFGTVNLRLLGPLGMDVRRGFFLDLDSEEAGNARIVGCSKAGCYADITLGGLDLIPFLTADEIGVTIWESEKSPYRVKINSTELKSSLDKIINSDSIKGGAGLLLSSADIGAKEISGSLNLQLKGSGADCDAVKNATVGFSIEDRKSIGQYFSGVDFDVFNKYYEDVLRKKAIGLKVSNFAFVDSIRNDVDDRAKEFAKVIDIGSVSFNDVDIDNMKVLSKGCDRGYFAIVSAESADGVVPSQYVYNPGNRFSGSYLAFRGRANNVSITTSASGGAEVAQSPVGRYMTDALFTNVAERALPVKYDLNVR